MAKKAAKKTARKKTAARKVARKKSARSRSKLTPRKDKIGLDAVDILLPEDDRAIADLVADIHRSKGAVIGAYREPLSGKPIVVIRGIFREWAVSCIPECMKMVRLTASMVRRGVSRE